MRKSKPTMILGLVLAMISCKKEEGTTDLPGGQNVNLVKVVQITPATGDTITVTLKWDSNGKLVEYQTMGTANPSISNTEILINRAGDGKINKIISKYTDPLNVNDSVVSTFNYITGTNRIAYVIRMDYSFYGNHKDSTIFTYNGAGKIASKEIFEDFLGSYMPGSRQTFEYDGRGNITRIMYFAYDGYSYLQKGQDVNTYDDHKAAMSLGEECFMILDPINASVNNLVGQVSNYTLSGENRTTVISDLVFNSFNRPAKFTMTTNANVFIDLKTMTFYYQ
jgi:hypothetical protein